MKFGYIWPSGVRGESVESLKVWTDDGRTTEASHTKSSPGAFGSWELKIKMSSVAIFVWRFKR